MEFNKEFLQNLVWDDCLDANVISDKIVDHSRWSVLYSKPLGSISYD